MHNEVKRDFHSLFISSKGLRRKIHLKNIIAEGSLFYPSGLSKWSLLSGVDAKHIYSVTMS